MNNQSNQVEGQDSKISESVYRRHVLRARSSSNHFTFSRDWVEIMPKYTALFLQDLINRASHKRVRKKLIVDKDGVEREYFMCSIKFMKKHPMDWDKNTQTRFFKYLEDPSREFVKTSFIGHPSRRWVYIDILKVETAVDKVLQEQSTGKNSQSLNKERQGLNKESPVLKQGVAVPKQGHKKDLTKESSKDEESSKGGNGRQAKLARPDPPQEKLTQQNNKTCFEFNTGVESNGHAAKYKTPPPDFCLEWARELRRILQGRKKPERISRSSAEVWAEDMRLLWRDWGMNDAARQRMDKILENYKKYIDLIEKPIIHNAKEFRDRYDWLENVMKDLEDKERGPGRWEHYTEEEEVVRPGEEEGTTIHSIKCVNKKRWVSGSYVQADNGSRRFQPEAGGIPSEGEYVD